MNHLRKEANLRNLDLKAMHISEAYKSEKALDEMVKECLPLNYEEDPVLLFGKLFEGSMDDFFEEKNCKKR